MELENLQNWIKENLLNSKNKINGKRIFKDWYKKNNYIKIYNEILKLTSFLNSKNVKFNQRLYHIMNNKFEKSKCEFCGNPTNYNNFNKGYFKYCSLTCRNHGTKNQRKKTNLKKYGVEFPLQSNIIKEKSKETCLKKYGVEFITQTENHKNIIKEKRKNESLEQKNKRNEKHKKSCLKNHGFGNQTNNEKRKKTNLKKYGVDSYSKTENFKKSFTESQIQNFKKLILPKILKNIIKNSNHKILNAKVSNVREKIKIKCEKNHIFERSVNGLTYNISCPLCDNNKSISEKEIYETLIKNELSILHNTKSIIPPLELDIFIPSHNLAIEYNGLFWHSELQDKKRNYHLNKTELCEKQNIQLIHIFENEWLNKQEIVKSVILSKLGIYNKRIYARKCVIKEIDSKTKNQFLEQNHLQGSDKSSIKLGLFNESNLVAIMTFGKRKITGKTTFELMRFCSKLNTQIIGGASKLFKHFLKNYDYETITTYADRRYSNGNFYKQLGFELSHISKPNYWYFKSGDMKLHHRVKFQKHKLNKELKNFDSNLTEWENMVNNGWNRIWDCGNYVFKYK